MGEDPSPSRPAVTDAAEPERLRREIEETRQELGDTVETLAAKTDVKAHAKETLERARSSAAKPVPLLTAGAVAAGLVLWRMAAHRRAAQRSTLEYRARRRLGELRARLR